jgi:hypothetical protein
MAKSDHIGKKIKESFESNHQKAPADLWSKINTNLDSDAQRLDEKVKASFEINDNKAPRGIWEGIDKQLTIDRGWVKVHKILQRRTVLKWTKRVAAILIFLFFVSRDLYPDAFYGAVNDRNINTKDHASFVSKIDKTLDKIDQKIVASSPKNKIELGQLSDKKYDVLKEGDTKPLNRNDISKNGGGTTNLLRKNNMGWSRSDKQIIVSDKDSSQLVSLNNSTRTISGFIAQLPIKRMNSLPLESLDSLSLTTKEYELDNKRFEFGLYSMLNSTAIINNQTRRAFDAQSLTVFNPSFGTSLGFQFVYHFDAKHSLASGLMFSSLNQSYNKYGNGNLNTERLNLQFVRFQSLYQFSFKREPSQKSAFNAKIGPYLGYLVSSGYSVNDVTVSESIDYYKNIDFGLSLQVGHSYSFKNFVFDIGLNNDLGLINIYKGEGPLPPLFDRTTTLGIGVYTSIRYKF